jgi:hypothetical protein
LSRDWVISADKMMNRAKGPQWHKKQKDKGIIPKSLRGIDKQATWWQIKEQVLNQKLPEPSFILTHFLTAFKIRQ